MISAWGIQGVKGLFHNSTLFLLLISCLAVVFPSRAWCNGLDTWYWRNPLPTGHWLTGVTYGNGTFVKVGYGGVIITSTDGVTWSACELGLVNSLYGVTYGNGTFVAVGNGGTIIQSAPIDAITQTPTPSPTATVPMPSPLLASGIATTLMPPPTARPSPTPELTEAARMRLMPVSSVSLRR
ncbi:MAG: hypothetical protein FJ266_06680 [Planctomycetes bacterium]|nr:hypothetical protein [Planctomycetota bacterium]